MNKPYLKLSKLFIFVLLVGMQILTGCHSQEVLSIAKNISTFGSKPNPMFFSLIPHHFEFEGLRKGDSSLIYKGINVKIDSEKNIFNIIPTGEYTNANIRVSDGKTGIVLVESEFIGILPPISIYLNDKRAGEYILSEDLINGGIRPIVENFDINLEFEVISYSVHIIAKDSIISYDVIVPNCWYTSQESNCSFFPPEIDDDLKRIDGNCSILFNKIKIRISDEVEKQLNPLTFVIKG